MDRKRYLSSLNNERYHAKVWKFLTVGSMISTICLSIAILKADFREKTIITPTGSAGICQQFSVTGDQYDTSAIECYARYFTNLRLTYHKETARYRFNEFTRHAHPAAFNMLRSHLHDEAQKIERHDYSSIFHPMEITVKENKAYITGEHILMVGKQIVTNKQKIFSITFKPQGGMLTINSFGEMTIDPKGNIVNLEDKKK